MLFYLDHGSAYRFVVGNGLLPDYDSVERRQVIGPGRRTIAGWDRAGAM
ncbi:MAG: hypothetical protein JO051_12430 [Acidobacteriaceae bacterium]|nr:hypothetical protein [Acidobacteriaceae bacterium]